MKLENRTKEELLELQRKKAALNYGLYMRARMLCSSRSSELLFVVPLHFLNLFFSHECYLPMKQVISLELVMNDDRSILTVEKGLRNPKRYKLCVTSIHLQLRLCTMEPRLKSRWLSSISSSTLTRNFQAVKVVHFNMKKSVMHARYSSVFSYSALPAYLKIFFISEKAHTGDFETQKFSYKHNNIQSIQLFKSGLPFSSNSMTNDMNMVKDGFQHMYFYREFQRFYGPSSYDITRDQFYDDLMCFCFNLSSNPLLEGDSAISLHAADRTLSFVEGAVLDVNLSFSKPLEDNTMVFFLGYFDAVQAFSCEGLSIV